VIALVTGGAGFIGSHLVDALVARGDEVRVLDDLSSGLAAALDPAARLIVGDVSDPKTLAEAVQGCEVVFHLAAHRSVPHSIEEPLATDRANTHGTLAVLCAARDAGVRRVVAASSSSVYGGAPTLPTPESAPTLPRSPYAVSKLAGEHYVRVFAELYGLEAVSLRYFNVYGPRQRPDSRYAAVVPRFLSALRSGHRPLVHGDGRQSRDFTYVADTVAATLAAAEAPADLVAGRAFNVACGVSHTVLEVLSLLGELAGVDPRPCHTEARPGDVRHTLADTSEARRCLGFVAKVPLEDGLKATLAWFDAERARTGTTR
jgi:UDP-glucose 4-epimerase